MSSLNDIMCIYIYIRKYLMKCAFLEIVFPSVHFSFAKSQHAMNNCETSRPGSWDRSITIAFHSALEYPEHRMFGIWDLQAETWPSHLAHDKTEDCRGRAVGHAEQCFLELAWICVDFHAWRQPLCDTALHLKCQMHGTDSTIPNAKSQRSSVPSASC